MTAPIARPYRRLRPAPPCPCGCGTRGLCDSHRARLASVRDELASEGRNVLVRRRRPGAAPTCCLPGCVEPREPGQHYCWEHADEPIPE